MKDRERDDRFSVRVRRRDWRLACVIAAGAIVAAPCAHAGWRSVSVPLQYSQPRPVLVDRAGGLWLTEPAQGFQTNLVRYDGATWTPLAIGGRVIRYSHQIVADSSGDTWVVGDYQLAGTTLVGMGTHRFDGRSWTTLTTADGLALDYYTSALVDRHGVVRLAHADGAGVTVSSYDGVSWTNNQTAAVMGDPYFRLLLVDAADRLWFGGSGRIAWSFDGASWSEYRIPGSQPAGTWESIVRWIAEDAEGDIWFGSEDAVARLHAGTVTGMEPIPLGGLTEARALFSDRDGHIWVQTNLGGRLHEFDGRRWRSSSPPDIPFSTNNARGGFCDLSGAFWFGELNLLWRFDREGVREYSGADGIGETQILDLYSTYNLGYGHGPFVRTARNGDLWVLDNLGLHRHDGARWTHFGSDSPPGIRSMCEDDSGRMWFGSLGAGVSRFDGTVWTTFTSADGLVDDWISQVLSDRHGGIWAMPRSGEATWAGVSHFDGTDWTTLPVPNGYALAGGLCDRQGNLWLGALGGLDPPSGLFRHDGVGWTFFGGGLASPYDGVVPHVWEDGYDKLWAAALGRPVAGFENGAWTPAIGVSSPDHATGFATDRSGRLWVAGGARLFGFDGTTWTDFTAVASEIRPNSVLPDRSAGVWLFAQTNISGSAGVTHFDGERFRAYGSDQGLPTGRIVGLAADSSGSLWLDVDRRLVRYTPDRVPPIPSFQSGPPALTGSSSLAASAATVLEPFSYAEYSYRLDGAAWTEWSTIPTWARDRIPDGEHVLEVRARDYAGNVSAHPARTRFEVDATPPAPVIASPAYGGAIRGLVSVRGSAADPRFVGYTLEYRPSGSTSWAGATLVAQSATEVTVGELGTWDTMALAEGAYDLRLTVADSLGLAGSLVVTVIVDNHAPFADETAPARVTAVEGGDVYTTNAEGHLYFPPRAFAQDAVVMVTAMNPGSGPATLPGAATKVLDGYDLAWAGALLKPARFTLSYAATSVPAGTLALYHSPDGSAWTRLGGTVDADAQSISLAVTSPGRYALYADDGLGAGAASLSPIAFTPRVFSPTGAFADREVGISFRLGRPAPVTVKVFSRSGRLIREVATGVPLQAGDNLIPWDGTDRNGGYVVDGVYFVTVEASGQTQTNSLAVVK